MHQDLDLGEITTEAAALVMIYPHEHISFSESVKKISRFICVEIYKKLEEQHIEWDDSHEAESNSFLDETESG